MGGVRGFAHLIYCLEGYKLDLLAPCDKGGCLVYRSRLLFLSYIRRISVIIGKMIWIVITCGVMKMVFMFIDLFELM